MQLKCKRNWIHYFECIFPPPGARDANSKAAYVKLNEKTEFTSKLIHFLFTRIAVAVIQLPVLIITLINYYINDLKEESYLLAFPIMLFRMIFVRVLRVWLIQKLIFSRLPFDWKRMTGYPVALTFTTLSLFMMFYTMVPTVSLAIGSAWLAETFVGSIINDVKQLSEMTKKSRKNLKKQKQMKHVFCVLVQDFSEVKQLSVLRLLQDWTFLMRNILFQIGKII